MSKGGQLFAERIRQEEGRVRGKETHEILNIEVVGRCLAGLSMGKSTRNMCASTLLVLQRLRAFKIVHKRNIDEQN